MPQHVIVGESDGYISESAAREPAAVAIPAPPDPPAPERSRLKAEEEVAAGLETILCGALKMAPRELDREMPLMDLGVDSISAAEIIEKVNAKWNTALKPGDVFRLPTLSSMAEYIAGIGGSTAGPAPGSADKREGSDDLVALLRGLQSGRMEEEQILNALIGGVK
jgi:acyl carrier protein